MHVFHSYFPGKPALARCPIDFYSSLVANLCILSVEVSTFHILLDTVPPSLLLGSASGSYPDFRILFISRMLSLQLSAAT